MDELFPILSGLVIGLFVVRIQDTKLRAVLIAVASIVFGAIATYISGEIYISWTYLLFDIAQVFVGIMAVWFFFTWRQRRTI